MKKLLLLALACPAFCAFSQNFTAKNQLAVSVGINWFEQAPQDLIGAAEHFARPGLTAGIHYARHFSPRWSWTASARFHRLNFKTVSGPLQWPSEWQNGQYVYDPSLPHQLTETHTDRAWQVNAGLRCHSRPAAWQWYGGLTTGLINHISPSGPGGPLRLTLGLDAGVEWRTGAFGLFAQPGAQYVFRTLAGNGFRGYRFFIPMLEAGGRYHF